jgi:hypothetical protein
MRPHLLFRGATFQFCGPDESREVPLLEKTSSDGFFHFDHQLLIYRVGIYAPQPQRIVYYREGEVSNLGGFLGDRGLGTGDWGLGIGWSF